MADAGDRHKPLFNGPKAKQFDTRLVKLEDLGYGAFGRVEKVMHGSVCLARKRITRRRGFTIEDLRQEGLTMRKLDHRHVVKLVATYAPRAHELCLLIWPAAVCNLSVLLEDLECLRTGDGDRDDIIERLHALDLKDLGALDTGSENQYLTSGSETCPFDYLKTVIGCVARAMAHCHANDVRHLDIKPSNILLKPDRVYLADFGISRDVSGQDQTTTDGLPGTERWRAPELYSDHGASMQLSDMYSLGLVYLNIATVLYDARLADFDEVLSYSARITREEQLRVREDKIKAHLETLTKHALVMVPFRFTYDGQETVRPRPLTTLISRMVTTNPRQRLAADKVDEKLSMLGGINQIYHGACCKRPVAWVEDKWDKKFGALISLQNENQVQRRRIEELEGKDATYEARLEKERQKHEQDISRLQTLLKDAEERCQRLEMERPDRRRRTSHSSRGSHGHHDMPRPKFQTSQQDVNTNLATTKTPQVGLGLPRSRMVLSSGTAAAFTAKKPTPTTAWQHQQQQQPEQRQQQQQQCQQQKQQNPHRSQSIVVPAQTRPTNNMRTLQSSPAVTQSVSAKSPSGHRSPSITSLPGYALRSRGSGSKLPLPVTPSSRSSTPVLNRDQSMTDSSMSSSVFSRHSIETAPTPPAHGSPVLQRTPTTEEKNKKPVWGQLPKHDERPLSPTAKPGESEPRTERPSTPLSPVMSMSPSAMSSPRTHRSDLVSDDGDANATARPANPPPLPSAKSWADVAKRRRG